MNLRVFYLTRWGLSDGYKTNNPPEKKILRGIISLFLVMMELLISNRARR